MYQLWDVRKSLMVMCKPYAFFYCISLVIHGIFNRKYEIGFFLAFTGMNV